MKTPDAERSRKCYQTNLGYRERKKAQAREWYRANRRRALKRVLRRQRVETMAERWLRQYRLRTAA